MYYVISQSLECLCMLKHKYGILTIILGYKILINFALYNISSKHRIYIIFIIHEPPAPATYYLPVTGAPENCRKIRYTTKFSITPMHPLYGVYTYCKTRESMGRQVYKYDVILAFLARPERISVKLAKNCRQTNKMNSSNYLLHDITQTNCNLAPI